MSNPSASRFLRRVLLVDALLTGATGALQILLRDWMERAFSLGTDLLLWTGVVLAVYALAVGLLSRRPDVGPGPVRAIILINLVWGVGCVAALAAGWIDPTRLGVAWVLLQVVAVAVFAELQVLGLRRGVTPTARPIAV